MNRSFTTAFGITACLLGQQTAIAQLQCGTDAQRARAIAQDPHILSYEQDLEAHTASFLENMKTERDGDTLVYIIPVVFHILHLEREVGNFNIPTENIRDAVHILNRDFRKLNADTVNVIDEFQGLVADSRIEFRLATKDFYGNCTNGIERIRSVETVVGDNGSKVSYWPRHQYLNIWVVGNMEDGVAGYSQYPSAVAGGLQAMADGVIIRYNYIGSLPPSSENNSRALTHEVGHYLNLQHCWGSTNDPTVACGDDAVEDTPNTKGHDSCDNPEDLLDFTCDREPLDTVYTFGGVTTSSGTTDPTPAPTVIDSLHGAGITMSAFSAHGVSGNSAVNGAFGFTEWPGGAVDGDTVVFGDLLGQQDLNMYYEFTVSPILGRAMDLTSLKFAVKRSLDGVRTYAVRVSTNGFSTNMTLSIAPANTDLSVHSGTMFFERDSSQVEQGTTVSLGSNFKYLRSPVTFRIYGFNSESPSGTFEVSDVRVAGTYGLIENTQNYMEYAYCSNMYTIGQRDRMRAALNSSLAARSALWQPQTLAAAGVDGMSDLLCAPEADFFPHDHLICTNTDVRFYDNSVRGEVDSWSWSFAGGNPATSTDQDPIVSFSEPGYKTVTLTVTNAQGTDTKTDEFAILIGSPFSEVGPGLNEPFNTVEPSWNWPTINWDNNMTQWWWEPGVGHYGPGCMKLNASLSDFPLDMIDNGDNDFDDLHSPTLDLRFLSGAELHFWYAYATCSTDLNEVTETLEVERSTDCGETWNGLLLLEGTDLITAGATIDAFMPASAADWREAIVPLSPLMLTNEVRLRFRYTSSGASSDLYIDDVNISGNVGMEELSSTSELSVWPNPTDGSFTVSFPSDLGSAPQLTIVDAQGRIVVRMDRLQGSRIALDSREVDLAPGVYSARISGEDRTVSSSFVVR